VSSNLGIRDNLAPAGVHNQLGISFVRALAMSVIDGNYVPVDAACAHSLFGIGARRG
jgi:hypothetical protein